MDFWSVDVVVENKRKEEGVDLSHVCTCACAAHMSARTA